MEEKFLKIFNRNIPIKDEYKIDEIKKAFLKESYSSGTEREQKLYIIFFTECTNNIDLQELIKICKTSSTKIKKLYVSFSKEQKINFGIFWSTRFRVEKEIGKITSRKDKTYTEIDNFESYELTPCIAYEMAIRNKEVKKMLIRHNKISNMLKNNDYSLFPSKNLYGFYYKIDNEEELSEKYEKAYDEYLKKEQTYAMFIKNDYKSFIDDYIDMCTALSISELRELKEKIEDELINYYLIYPTGYSRQIPHAGSMSLEKITNSKKEKMKKVINDQNVEDKGIGIRYEKIIHDEFIQLQSIYYGSGKYINNNIIPNFNRQVNDQNQISIAINFFLPEDEIIEYIKRIKKKINPKTFFELLGHKLEKANDSTSMQTVDSNNNKISLDLRKGENPQNKFADMLYVYDMKNRGFTNFEIITQMIDFYSHKTTSLSEKTVKKYFLIAKDYIENKKYKELITGKVEKKQ